MLKAKTLEVAGIVSALQAVRLPHNGSPKSLTSTDVYDYYPEEDDSSEWACEVHTHTNATIHSKDLKLMQNLQRAGDHHAKALRGIVVWVEIEAPIYWWWDLETYGVGHQRLCSASTMHTECKGLYGEELQKVKSEISFGRMIKKIDYFSYPTLRRIAFQRHNHRLPEFREFIAWMRTLPLAEELIFDGLDKLNNGDPDLPTDAK